MVKYVYKRGSLNEYFFLNSYGLFYCCCKCYCVYILQKKKNLYFAAFTILVLAVVFGGIGGVLALFIIRDAFAIFYGLQVGYYLLINSVIVFLIAILATVIKRYNNRTT